MMKFLFLFSLILSVGLCAQKTQVSEPLRIGMELTYPPFETIDQDGKPAGISVKMAHALGDFLHRAIVIENIPFVGLIPALKSGKIDLILSSFGITEERKKSIDFSDPYVKVRLDMLVNAKSSLHNAADANQKGYIVCVKQGTVGETYANTYLKNTHIQALDREYTCVLEVIQGKADLFIYDQFSVYAHHQKDPKATRIISGITTPQEWAFGLRKGDTALKEQINAFIKHYPLEQELPAYGA